MLMQWIQYLEFEIVGTQTQTQDTTAGLFCVSRGPDVEFRGVGCGGMCAGISKADEMLVSDETCWAVAMQVTSRAYSCNPCGESLLQL